MCAWTTVALSSCPLADTGYLRELAGVHVPQSLGSAMGRGALLSNSLVGLCVHGFRFRGCNHLPTETCRAPRLGTRTCGGHTQCHAGFGVKSVYLEAGPLTAPTF